MKLAEDKVELAFANGVRAGSGNHNVGRLISRHLPAGRRGGEGALDFVTQFGNGIKKRLALVRGLQNVHPLLLELGQRRSQDILLSAEQEGLETVPESRRIDSAGPGFRGEFG